MLNSILSTSTTSTFNIGQFLICLAVSLILGLLLIFLHSYKNHTSKSFMLTLALLPIIVQTVILIVNGNLGTGVAVMGAFSLVRFRSVPGNAREISSIFLAMTIGLANGTGYIGISILVFIAVALITILLLNLSIKGFSEGEKSLHIMIPENLDYHEIFDDIFQKYTKTSELIKVKTVNMGSLFDLHYQISLKDEKLEKKMIDELRCRNGNLSISCSRTISEKDEL